MNMAQILIRFERVEMKNLIIFIAICIIAIGAAVNAEDGVTDTEIILGQSCALNGPAEALGKGMKSGLLAAFENVNAAGGVKGKKIKLISLDDGYEPDKAIQNTRLFIEKENVFLLIGEVGTPTSKAVVPIATDAGVPFFGPFTGAEFLRNPFKKWVVNIRGSYNQEMEKHAEYLVGKKGLKKIACFYQDDGYGQAGLSGIKIALEKRGLKLVAEGTYKRNTLAIKRGLLKIREAQPEAVVMVGAYKPCAEFIRLAKKLGMTDVIYCNISFVGTAALKKELGNAGEGCMITQVMPLPTDTSVPIVTEYQKALSEYQKHCDIGFVSLEGYVVGKLFCNVVENIDGELNRENFMKAVSDTGTFDLGGITLTFGPNDHQGSESIFLTQIKNGEIVQVK